VDIKKINDEAGKLIEYLKQTDLESYEKICSIKICSIDNRKCYSL
jgi:hypothetical protein